jgi:hypothetical protein
MPGQYPTHEVVRPRLCGHGRLMQPRASISARAAARSRPATSGRHRLCLRLSVRWPPQCGRVRSLTRLRETSREDLVVPSMWDYQQTGCIASDCCIASGRKRSMADQGVISPQCRSENGFRALAQMMLFHKVQRLAYDQDNGRFVCHPPRGPTCPSIGFRSAWRSLLWQYLLLP